MNILITAIGSFSAEAVIRSLSANSSIKLTGTDIYPAEWLPAARLLEKVYQVPLVSESAAYVSSMLDICKKENIGFVFPLTDPEVDILSGCKKKFEENGVIICTSDHDVINICRDKHRMYDFFKESPVVEVIPTFNFKDHQVKGIEYPLIAKPVRGRSSEGIIKIQNDEDHAHAQQAIADREYIIQPYLKGNIYTVDYIRNHSSAQSQAICREELLRNFNGAGLTVKIIHSKALAEMADQAGRQLGINGCVNFEFLENNGRFYLMDINPRFSAGVAFSILAGYDMVKNHLNCFIDLPIETEAVYKEQIIAKTYSEIIL